jgi:di/tricarboxylate transporter
LEHYFSIRPEINSLSVSKEQFRNSLKRKGKVTREEKIVLSILFSTLILWIVPSLIRSFFPQDLNGNEEMDIMSIIFYNFAKNIPESVPTLFIILVIGLIRIKRSNTDSFATTYPLLNWNGILKVIDWNIVFLLVVV